jgi:hypothetical protein
MLQEIIQDRAAEGKKSPDIARGAQIFAGHRPSGKKAMEIINSA